MKRTFRSARRRASKTIGGIAAGLARLRSVHLERAVRFLRKIHQVGNGSLHAKRHLVLADARLDLGISILLGVLAIQICDTYRACAVASIVRRLAASSR